jgi:hypothetical protein
MPFSLQPIVLQTSGGWKFAEQALLLLSEQIRSNKIQTIKQSIGDGLNNIFTISLPFERLISWRVISTNLDAVIEPDVQVRSRQITLTFGTPPNPQEFEIEIIGFSDA